MTRDSEKNSGVGSRTSQINVLYFKVNISTTRYKDSLLEAEESSRLKNDSERLEAFSNLTMPMRRGLQLTPKATPRTEAIASLFPWRVLRGPDS